MKSVLIDEKTDEMAIGHEALHSTICELENAGYVWSDITVEQAGTGRSTTVRLLSKDD